MDDILRTKQQLITELVDLRRHVAELESAAIDHRQIEQRLRKDARTSDAELQRSAATAHALLESASQSGRKQCGRLAPSWAGNSWVLSDG